jgi:hypothetical protein
MSAALRFEQLKTKFRQAVPGRRLSPRQRHDITRAANLEQVREIAAIEVGMGKPHDATMLALMSVEITNLLVSAGAKFTTRTKHA